MCFLAPLLACLSESDKPSKAGRALVLAPLKALAHDLLRATKALQVHAASCADAAEASDPRSLPPASVARLRRIAALVVASYDGDTPAELRPSVRKTAQLIFTNIDMLHSGLLPHHGAWPVSWWANLRTVVLDEARGRLHTARAEHRVQSFMFFSPFFLVCFFHI